MHHTNKSGKSLPKTIGGKGTVSEEESLQRSLGKRHPVPQSPPRLQRREEWKRRRQKSDKGLKEIRLGSRAEAEAGQGQPRSSTAKKGALSSLPSPPRQQPGSTQDRRPCFAGEAPATPYEDGGQGPRRTPAHSPAEEPGQPRRPSTASPGAPGEGGEPLPSFLTSDDNSIALVSPPHSTAAPVPPPARPSWPTAATVHFGKCSPSLASPRPYVALRGARWELPSPLRNRGARRRQHKQLQLP